MSELSQWIAIFLTDWGRITQPGNRTVARDSTCIIFALGKHSLTSQLALPCFDATLLSRAEQELVSLTKWGRECNLTCSTLAVLAFQPGRHGGTREHYICGQKLSHSFPKWSHAAVKAIKLSATEP